MLNFNYLEIYGFGSLIGPIKFEFGNNGLTLVKGLNGAGKTTIFSALTWVAYGQQLKDKSKPTTWDHVQPKDYKGVKGELNFSNGKHDVTIIRCENYKDKVEGSKGGKRLILKVDGQVQQQYGDKITTQSAINKLLGMSFDLFVNSIVFGQKMKRIIDETGPKQKNIFDEAFEVNYVNNAKDSVDVDYKMLRDSFAKLTNDLSTLNNNIKSTKELFLNSKDSEQRFEELKQENITKAAIVIKILKAELNRLKKQKNNLKKELRSKLKFIKNWDLDGWEKADDEYQVSKSAIIMKNTSITLMNDTITRLAKEILKHPKKCDKCGAPLDKAKRKELLDALNSDRKKAKVKLNTLEVEKSGLIDDRDYRKGLLDGLNENKKEYDKAESDVRFIKNQIDNINKALTDTKEKIKEAKSNKVTEENKELIIKSKGYKNNLIELRDKRKPIKKALKAATKELEILDWLVKDPLSNSGLKTYIFNSMLGAVNDELYRYATILGFEVEFAINMESKRKEFYSLIAKDGHIIPFNDLSGGQKQLVNIAIAFAIHAVVNKSNNVNILIMDEVFESLDAINIDIVNELIQMKAEEKAIYLVTHQKDFNPRNCDTIHFQLDKTGISRVV